MPHIAEQKEKKEQSRTQLYRKQNRTKGNKAQQEISKQNKKKPEQNRKKQSEQNKTNESKQNKENKEK